MLRNSSSLLRHFIPTRTSTTSTTLLHQSSCSSSSGFVRSMSSNNNNNGAKFWFVQYDYIPDILEKRGPHRANHLKYAGKFRDNGSLIIGGAFNPPIAAGVVFKSNDKTEVEKFCQDDPYVQNGLVKKFTIREWNVVVSSIDDSNLKL